MYEGHLSDGSSVQRHSAGPIYPYVLAARQTDNGLQYGLIGGELDDYQWIGTYDQAFAAARDRLALRERGRQFKTWQNSRNRLITTQFQCALSRIASR